MRTQARTIGLRAIRWAAAERQHEEALARQRKEVLQRLQQRAGGAAGSADGAAAASRDPLAGVPSLAAAGREIAAALAEPEVKGAGGVEARLGVLGVQLWSLAGLSEPG